ncbi:MAG: DUF3821 domain-containing protein [Methanoregula sp.]|jgi:hypothetical protein|uniref:DUF3821 domain-containing protein n=1 Tax=Methanoregula sp. TaxID=2052170 RepID=UPI0025DAFD00|nr:DUF3821 domain-containing protein [Methanoregula sp.]MCK9631311.1 DUF3821 domain-containing protein [Methanoregula sp.]
MAADFKTISAGNTVYIGEQGLDITSILASGTQIGWWASGASISGSSPDYTLTVADASNFYVSPSEFSTRTGSWYVLPAKTQAFNVVDPQLDIRVEDTTVSVDVTNKWVPTDDELQFRIDSNLVQIAQRTGSGGSVPVTIKVQSPDGGVYSSLINKAGTSTSLVDYLLTTTPQYTGAIWGTSNRGTYIPGTYTIWVECNVNSMKDNYGQSGKTISNKVTLLNQDRNPLIGNQGYVTNPTTAVTTKIYTTVTTRSTTSVVPTTIPATTIPVTTLPTTDVTAPVETILPITTMPESTAVPTTHTPGFEAGLAIAAAIFGLVLCLKKK